MPFVPIPRVAKKLYRATLRSDDGGCLRWQAEVENIGLRISGSCRAKFPAVAVLSAMSKQCLPLCRKREHVSLILRHFKGIYRMFSIYDELTTFFLACDNCK